MGENSVCNSGENRAKHMPEGDHAKHMPEGDHMQHALMFGNFSIVTIRVEKLTSSKSRAFHVRASSTAPLALQNLCSWIASNMHVRWRAQHSVRGQ